jgi:hypothetical protein
VVTDLSVRGFTGAGGFAGTGGFAIGFVSGVFAGCSSVICSLLMCARIDRRRQCGRELQLAIRWLYIKLHLHAFQWQVLVATW